MVLSHLQGRPDHFEADKFVAALLESGDDIPNQATLDSVGLDGKKCPLPIGASNTVDGKGGITKSHGQASITIGGNVCGRTSGEEGG